MCVQQGMWVVLQGKGGDDCIEQRQVMQKCGADGGDAGMFWKKWNVMTEVSSKGVWLRKKALGTSVLGRSGEVCMAE